MEGYSYNIICPICKKMLGKVEDGINAINILENSFRCNECKRFFIVTMKFNHGALQYNTRETKYAKKS